MPSTKSKPCCSQLYPWLRANLGPRCLAPLTGTDARALKAAVHIIELYAYDMHDANLTAFNIVVRRMQEHTQQFAYHAIAMVMDWSDRNRIWFRAGLPSFDNKWVCVHEPHSHIPPFSSVPSV